MAIETQTQTRKVETSLISDIELGASYLATAMINPSISSGLPLVLEGQIVMITKNGSGSHVTVSNTGGRVLSQSSLIMPPDAAIFGLASGERIALIPYVETFGGSAEISDGVFNDVLEASRVE